MSSSDLHTSVSIPVQTFSVTPSGPTSASVRYGRQSSNLTTFWTFIFVSVKVSLFVSPSFFHFNSFTAVALPFMVVVSSITKSPSYFFVLSSCWTLSAAASSFTCITHRHTFLPALDELPFQFFSEPSSHSSRLVCSHVHFSIAFV